MDVDEALAWVDAWRPEDGWVADARAAEAAPTLAAKVRELQAENVELARQLKVARDQRDTAMEMFDALRESEGE